MYCVEFVVALINVLDIDDLAVVGTEKEGVVEHVVYTL